MKPTKKQEREIMQVYEAYWAEYLDGNVDGMVPLLDASYTQVGSAESEVFSTKKEAVQFLVDTIDQVAGKLEMRNRSTKLEQQDGLVLVHELCDLYALADKEWIFYSKFRASTLLKENKEGYKITHQHSSFPDSKTEDGQNVAIEKIASENQQLREAVKRRTVELEQKNRELEIETALEKVRAKSMAMYKSEELADLSLELVKQVQNLGVATWFCAFNIYDEDQSGSLEWGSNGQGTFPKYRTPREGIFLRYYKAGQRGESLLVNEIGEKECPGHYEYLCTLPGVGEQLLKMKDSGIPFPKSQIDHVAYFKYGYVLFITYEPAPESHDIFKRFAKVFEQTYTRFLDLQKAEAQAREVQIELALERVRARTMAMQKSEELAETSMILFNQLLALGFKPRACGFLIMDEESQTMDDWSANVDEHGKGIHVNSSIAFDQHTIIRQVVETWQKGDPYFIGGLHGEELQKYYDAVTLKETSSRAIKEKVLSVITSEYTNSFYFEYGMLYVLTAIPLTDNEINMLLRFAGVLKLTYRRFLDLQKAEAQAREAQIEVALERVRSRSMAMHKSDELKEVVKVIFNQMAHLKINADHAGIVVDYEPKKDFHFWVADNQDIPARITVPYLDLPWDRQFTEAKKNGKDFFTTQLDFEEKNSFYKKLLPHIEGLTKQARDFYLNCPGLAASTAIQKDIGLYIENFSGTLFSAEENNILMRFAKVFQQSFTRFLDLQKAEVQAKEAQIEAALERVRAKAMAMHSSEDLSQTVNTFFNELKILGLSMRRCGVGILDVETKIVDVHVTTETETQDSKMMTGKLTLSGHTVLDQIFETFIRQEEYHPVLRGKELSDYYKAMNPQVEYPDFTEDDVQYGYYFHFKEGGVFTWTDKELAEADLQIFRRYTSVLSLTYRRYLDLKEAEAQAREAQIEAALEKVRSQSLAMHTTEEMQQVANAVYEQLHELGLEMDAVGMSGVIEAKQDYDVWVGGVPFGRALRIPFNTATKVQRDYNKMLEERPELFAKTYSGKVKEEYINHLLTHGDFPKVLKKKMETSKAFSTSIALAKKSSIQILRYTNRPYSGEDNEIVKRFSKVFEQAYIRFMDLQKAEEQAREAQIETALEKVRSRTMAMHKSKEMLEVIGVVSEQLQLLNLNFDTVSFAKNNQEGDFTFWITSKGQPVPILMEVPTLDSPILKGIYKAQKKGITFLADVFSSKVNREWHEHLIKYSDLKKFPDKIKDFILNAPGFARSSFLLKNIDLYVGNYRAIPFTDEENSIFRRFAHVFEQSYTRFLDLQKAEAQAKEAQIENALEKVRSRTMAMQKGEEVKDVVVLLYKELIKLGVTNFVTCGYVEINETTNRQETWVTSPGGDSLGLFYLPLTGDATFDERYAAWKKQQVVFHQKVAGEVRSKHLEYAITTFNSKEAEEMVLGQFPDPCVFYCFNFSHGYLHIVAGSKLKEEEESLLARFTRVFEQTYARFLDLKKAEAQTREAQIENALEKVRSRTMAMQKSEELPEAANNLFLQVQELGIPAWSAGYCIWETEDKKAASCNMSSEGEIQKSFILPTIGEGYNFYDPLKKGETFYIEELGGDALVKHYEFMRTLPNVGEILEELIKAGLSLPTFQIFHILYFPHGYLMFITYEQVLEAHDIFKRFAKVFEQTYTRFLDLKKAEAQAREATKQASLDRVRGQIASMRSTADLNRITPLVWNELITIGVPFIRCGVFIIDEPTKIVEVYLSAPDGHSLGVLNLKFNADPLTKNTVVHWRKGKIFKAHWNREEFINWTQSLMEQGQISDKNTYQGAANPPESLNLHFIPFTQGMLYVGSEHPLVEEHIELAQSLADAFAIAYARYEDFTKLEKAKLSVETALSELKATQNQLVQSEKMASLGELTAGIAHEIQNPLNFVNNFSEVSGELIEEMNEEIEKGDMEEAKAIANDVKQNLEKILHHGKRADAIVKGMLQHSRSSTGVKEPTDINALADEYLRLAYHGLRAKDKSFNATMKTDYDDTIEKVNVIPQDIGRVILNLITNAFYVVDEKKKQLKDGYEPTVSVSTKKGAGKIEISVKDNGNGIPEKVKEKIFQPFFTTKPTGKGTGLGLSMSYDIVNKGHGGELRVETTEGEGTTFTIALPMA